MATETRNKSAVAEVSVHGGSSLDVVFVDGRRAAVAIADLPFGSPTAADARVSMDGSFVTLDGPEGWTAQKAALT